MKNLYEGRVSLMITKIKKRDGREVPFNIEKITNAIFKATKAAGQEDYDLAMILADKVVQRLHEDPNKAIPTVEEIQDIVEKVLIEEGHANTAKNTYFTGQKELVSGNEYPVNENIRRLNL